MSDQTVVQSFSGVRGIVDDGLTDDVARAYARVFVQDLLSHASQLTLVVASDTRESSERFRNIFVEIFQDAGARVYDLGATTTPVAEFAVQHTKAHGGVMITASHNPPEYNGWKFLDNTGAIVAAERMERLITAFAQNGNDYKKSSEAGKIILYHQEAIDAYCTHVLGFFSEAQKKQCTSFEGSVVIDPNGSAVWEVAEKLLTKLGIGYVGIRTTAGVFEREIEPHAHSLADVAKIVQEKNASFGCGFDCDADRVELVLPASDGYAHEHGSVVSGQYVLALGVDSVLSQEKLPQPVVVNYATSQLVWELAKKYEAEVVEVDVGEINVVSKMREVDSGIGGEGSSSGVIVRGGTCRDGILVILLTLKLLAQKKQTLGQVLAAYPQYHEARAKLACAAERVEILRKKIIQHYQEKDYTVVHNDDPAGGVKVYIDKKTWIFFRASKTELGQFRIIVNAPIDVDVDFLLQEAQQTFESLA